MKIAKIPQKSIYLSKKLRAYDGGRDISYYLKKLGMKHHASMRGVKMLKKIFHPIEAITRKRQTNDEIGVSGYTTLKINGAEKIAEYCANLFKKHEKKLIEEFEPPYGFVLTSRREGEDIYLNNPEDFKPIIDFCLKPKILDLVTGYIGEAPVISDVSLVYTMPNSTKVGPQKFHVDANEYKQLHIVMPVWDVDEESGPFTFLPADKSKDFLKKINHDTGRIEDETMFEHYSKDDLVECTGKPGGIYVLNPCQCVHFGARTKSKPRLMLIINMTSLFEGGEGTMAIYRAKNRDQLSDGSKKSKLLLNLK